MCFDENGRLFVVEMIDYSERRDERLGRIRMLEDLDGDGHFDKSTVFADNLPWPTAVFCYGGGIANTLAVRMGGDLAAAVAFYGAAPPAPDVAKIKAAILVHQAGLEVLATERAVACSVAASFAVAAVGPDIRCRADQSWERQTPEPT